MEQIFVSSVQKELQTERYAVRDFVHGNDLLRQFFHVFLFEDLPPADRHADDVYLDEVAKSPIYVGLFGNEYGREDDEGVSPTEKEFNLASKQRKRRLIFVKGCDDSARKKKMNNLIRRAGDEVVRRRFDDTDELLRLLYGNLIQYLQDRGFVAARDFDATPCPDATLRDISPRNRIFIKNPWFITISIGLLFFILGLIYYKAKIQTKGDYSPGVVEGDYQIGDDVSGDKMEIENVFITKDEKKEIEEKLQILLSIREIRNSGRNSKGWNEIAIDVVNAGDLPIYLEKAEFYCNDKLLGIASLKRVKTQKIGNNSTSYEEYYPKLDPGVKIDDLNPDFHNPKAFQVAINPGDFRGKLTIKIKTTRASWFSKNIHR